MVVLEGMLYGLAIAASAVGGPAEILEHERTGLLFPAKNSAAQADTIARLALDAEVRQRIGAAAADEVRRTWLWPEIVVRMGSVYREAAAEVCRPVSNGRTCVAQLQHLRPVA
jgi:glycosyltransferase involved in cell wall biosynthesis